RIDAEVRFSSIGYIQRGGMPTVRSRILANLFSAKAVEMIFEDKKDLMVGIIDNKISENELTGKKRVIGEREIYMLNLAEKLAI
ncbi:MAG: ATP-dependent 6-phosphofructokinase, partial [Nitrososphaeria archaeon]